MAVYTYFGSMAELRRAVRREGFQRLADGLDRVPADRNPLAYLATLGAAYYANGVANPHLYGVMFQEKASVPEDAAAALATFERLVAAVERCISNDQLSGEDPRLIATRFWAEVHGVLTLRIASLVTDETALHCLRQLALDLFTAGGARRDRKGDAHTLTTTPRARLCAVTPWT